MMIEYPPQTFLSSRDSPWKCLLVGKRIEPCSQKQALNDLHVIKQCGCSNT